MNMIKCIPNFSEGRNHSIIEELADAVRATAGVMLLHYSADADHNRSVFCFAGNAQAVMDAAFNCAQIAVKKIDLRSHTGEHPRIGAVDVIPFVPLGETGMAECVELSKALGQKLWNELRLPVYLYEESASAPHRRNLANLRKGQFEGMAEKIKTAGFAPDYGDELHRSAGITACGARGPLIAFNVNLNSNDISIAKKIAKSIRERDGGLKYVKSIGIMLATRNIAQVSINLTDYRQTPICQVLEAVKTEAARHGVSILGVEIIGLLPADALQP